MSEGAVDDTGVDVSCLLQGGERGLEGESIFLEPGEEGCVTKEAGVGILRGVDVGVCESLGERRNARPY